MSGIVLMIDKPFVIGDWLEIGTIEGIIEDVSFRSTRIRTFTQGLVVVPNATLSNDNIINWSLMPKRRVLFELGVSYDTTEQQLTYIVEAIKKILASDEDIEKDTSIVAFDHFGDYALQIRIMYFTLKVSLAEYAEIKERINLQLLQLAEQHQITIAFPTQEIRLKNE